MPRGALGGPLVDSPGGADTPRSAHLSARNVRIECRPPGNSTSDATLAVGRQGVVTKFMTVLPQAIKWEKSDEAYAEKLLSEHLKVTDPQALTETYQYYAKEVLSDVPTPTAPQLQTSKDELTATNPAVKNVNVAELVDVSYLRAAQ
jgi:hypothetical protein